MPSNPCVVVTCFTSHPIRHRFPNPSKNMLLFNEWVKVCRNPRLQETGMTSDKIYNSCRVCHKHFSANDIVTNNRLKKDAIPLLFMPAIEQEEAEKPQTPIIESEHQTVRPTGPSLREHALEFGNQPRPIIETDTPVPSSSRHDSPVPSPSCISPVQSRKHGLLAEVGSTRTMDLTPKAKHLYQRARYFQKRAARSTRTKMSLKQRLDLSLKYSQSETLKKALSSLDKIRERFFECQFANIRKRAKGRRYTLEDKVLGLALFKQSASGYKLISKLFTLPSPKTCIRLLQKMPIKPGLSISTYDIMKAEIKNFQNPLDKYCIIMFDEMSLSPSLSWSNFEGDVVGFEDFGYKRSNNIADHVMVVMLRGIIRKWKQPVFYNFVHGATSNADITNIIKVVVQKCSEIGLRVVATVCDQGRNNEAAIKNLVWETKRRYLQDGKQWEEFAFEVGNDLIVPLFDAPHLLKGLRNNLLKANLKFQLNGEEMMAKWDHILTAYQLDPYLGSLRAMPKLTEQHVNPSKINKMKVSFCTQVFSRSVAVGINLMAYSGTTVRDENGREIRLEHEAQQTAKLLEFFDDVFDSLNGNSFSSTKPLRTAVTDTSPHILFWKKALTILSSMQYIMNNGRKFVPPSITNLIKTIKNIQMLYNILKKEGFSYLMPRNLNQDPVENFFCKIRQRGSRNNNPTCLLFKAFYKSLLVNNLVSTHSIGANCMEDDAEYLVTLQRFVTQGLPEDDEYEEEVIFSVIPENLPAVQTFEQQVLRYVCGYLFKKIETTCKDCTCKDEILSKTDLEGDTTMLFTRLKEYNNRRTTLKYVNKVFYEKMKLALQIIQFILRRDLHKKGVFKHIYDVLMAKINITNCIHNSDIKNNIFKYFIKVTGHNFLKQLNRIIRGQDLRHVSENAPLVFRNCKNVYNKTFRSRKTK